MNTFVVRSRSSSVSRSQPLLARKTNPISCNFVVAKLSAFCLSRFHHQFQLSTHFIAQVAGDCNFRFQICRFRFVRRLLLLSERHCSTLTLANLFVFQLRRRRCDVSRDYLDRTLSGQACSYLTITAADPSNWVFRAAHPPPLSRHIQIKLELA